MEKADNEQGTSYKPAPWVLREFLLTPGRVQIATLNNQLAFDLQNPFNFPQGLSSLIPWQSFISEIICSAKALVRDVI
jgi:hypothetical protein